MTADVDEFRAVIRPVVNRLTFTAAGRFAATARTVNLHHLQMQSVQETLPRILDGEPNPIRHALSFLVEPGLPAVSNGGEVWYGDLGLHNCRSIICHRLSGPTLWGSVSLPLEDWREIGVAVVGRDLTPSADLPKITPPERAMASLRRLHAAAIHLGEHAPELIANPEAARGLEQELIQAVVNCLHGPSAEAGTIAQRHHTAIIRRFRNALEESADRAVYLPQLCAAIGVSDRTLRKCCQQHFGMGPKRYLFLRRMHLANQALRRASASEITVTDVATEFGFWELGRFAVEYRSLFSESPSATLRQTPQ
ncbi:MAG: helix-turn-helix domain-containing protein [Acetobacteraceae bacterium]